MAAHKTTSDWLPRIGELVRYVSRHSTLTRYDCPVLVVAEAAGQRMRIEIIGRTGEPVLTTVKSSNLHPLPPGLFDGIDP